MFLILMLMMSLNADGDKTHLSRLQIYAEVEPGVEGTQLIDRVLKKLDGELEKGKLSEATKFILAQPDTLDFLEKYMIKTHPDIVANIMRPEAMFRFMRGVGFGRGMLDCAVEPIRIEIEKYRELIR